MAIIKCKMCGGDIELAADKTFGTCEYCGSTMTFPKVDDDQRAAAFNRGNHFRRIGEFDKALAVYERIVRENETDAEAHWCCALCRFGIEYVEDPATYEWLPTCHRASFDSFLEDVDYLAAVEHSEGITRRQYQKDAAKIAEVQRGILATSQSEEPFDVFICYKESDENGERTRDSLMAQDVYYQLTDQGYRVFFSRITLEDMAGKQYEPYIFAALNSAKVMIAIGTKPEYMNAVWVKNEWSRFLAMMKKDRNKLLLPCYRDMDPYDMPEQLSVLQSYDMSKIGFIQDLIRGVSKVLGSNEPRRERHEPSSEQFAAVQKTATEPLLRRGYISLEDEDWEKADAFFENVLNADPEAAEAYVGKLCAELECCGIDELPSGKFSFCHFLPDIDIESYGERVRNNGVVEVVFELSEEFELSLDEAAAWADEMLRDATLLEDVQQMLNSANYRRALEFSSPEMKQQLEGLVECRDPSEPFEWQSLVYRYNEFNGDWVTEKTLFIEAVEMHDIEKVRVLLENGACVNDAWVTTKTDDSCVEKEQRSILVSSAEMPEMLKLLLDYGADPNWLCTDDDNRGEHSERSPLHEAVLYNNPESVKLLLSRGADAGHINRSVYFDKEGNVRTEYENILYRAIQSFKNPEIIKLLLDAGADANFVTNYSDSDGTYHEQPVLSAAVLADQVEIVKHLLNAGANVNAVRLYRTAKGDSYYSPLRDAICTNKNLEIVNLLLDAGADVNQIQKVTFTNSGTYGEITIISEAIRKNNAKAVELLLVKGTDANAMSMERNEYGDNRFSALSQAVRNAKNADIARLLIASGADPNFVFKVHYDNGNYGEKPVITDAVLAGNEECVKVLLAAGVNANAVRLLRSQHGDSYHSALRDAITRVKKTSMVELLLKSGADATRADPVWFDNGTFEQSCMLACAFFAAQSVDMMRLLMRYGASMKDTVTYNGRQIPFKKYPINPSHKLLPQARAFGWKGPGIFDKF